MDKLEQNSANIISFVSINALIFSVLHNFIYFKTIGFDFLGSMTITDHLASAVLFAPLNFSIVIIMYMVSYTAENAAEKNNSHQPDIGININSNLIKEPWFWFFLLFPLISYVFSPDFSAALFFPLTMLLVLRFVFIPLEKKYSEGKRNLRFRTIIITALFALHIGHSNAINALREEDSFSIISKTEKYENVKILKQLEKGTLIMHSSDLFFIPHSEILKIHKIKKTKNHTPLMCRFFQNPICKN